VSGFEVVAEAAGLADRIAAADLVVTGEGSFDAQSAQGKTTGRVLALAAAAGKPATVFAGHAEAGLAAETIAALEPDPAVAMRDAGALLTEIARRWAARQA
jgi:glycerate kinase